MKITFYSNSIFVFVFVCVYIIRVLFYVLLSGIHSIGMVLFAVFIMKFNIFFLIFQKVIYTKLVFSFENFPKGEKPEHTHSHTRGNVSKHVYAIHIADAFYEKISNINWNQITINSLKNSSYFMLPGFAAEVQIKNGCCMKNIWQTCTGNEEWKFTHISVLQKKYGKVLEKKRAIRMDFLSGLSKMITNIIRTFKRLYLFPPMLKEWCSYKRFYLTHVSGYFRWKIFARKVIDPCLTFTKLQFVYHIRWQDQ